MRRERELQEEAERQGASSIEERASDTARARVSGRDALTTSVLSRL